jgi:DNA-binding transcriptional MerR regulator
MRHLYTATEATTWLGIPASTVRTWARREQIWSFGLDERNRPMYDRDDLVRLRDRRTAVA